MEYQVTTKLNRTGEIKVVYRGENLFVAEDFYRTFESSPFFHDTALENIVVRSFDSLVDPSKFKHIFPVFEEDADIESPEEYRQRLVDRGAPVVASCGFAWWPTIEPTDGPLCAECSQLLDEGYEKFFKQE